jgi:DNA-binding transcriptional regulator YiaG
MGLRVLGIKSNVEMITIKEARRKLGLTQKEFSPLLGMTQQAVARIESEERKETKGHRATLQAIELIFEHGLLAELIARCKAN